MRRWTEQRWALDNIIRANGLDWDQPHLGNLAASLGAEASADIAAINARVKKFADIAPAFEAAARRREAKAKAAEAAKANVSARENYYMASNYWASAQWPIDENNEQNRSYNAKKRECFEHYARLADHHVEAAWIPFDGKALPGWFHLPPGYAGGKIPAVVSIPGMDGYKERAVALYGDRWLSRGVAALVIEGPGQYEAPVLDIYVTMPGWERAGKALMEWMLKRPEIDPSRIGLTGSSFGSLFATVAAASEPRFKACSVISTCLEPGCRTIFEEASPTFKKRFMYMAGYQDEAKFDEFRKELTWEGYADKIKMPYLCIAGEADELAPIATSEALVAALPGPKQIVIYEGSRHAVGGVPATNLGPSPFGLLSDWMMERFEGSAFPNERWYVDGRGNVNKTALAKR
jgi:cephalosporin-C deacetylase-like acetyl esterase